MADAEGRSPDDASSLMPPAYVGLHDRTSLRHIGQMYGFFNQTKWCTCVCCWRAWYHAPLHYAFDEVNTKNKGHRPWFLPAKSKILKCETTRHIDRWTLDFNELSHQDRDEARLWQPVLALRFLEENYPPETFEQILTRLADRDRRRFIVLCISCEPFVRNGKLGVTGKEEKCSRPRLCD